MEDLDRARHVDPIMNIYFQAEKFAISPWIATLRLMLSLSYEKQTPHVKQIIYMIYYVYYQKLNQISLL